MLRQPLTALGTKRQNEELITQTKTENRVICRAPTEDANKYIVDADVMPFKYPETDPY